MGGSVSASNDGQVGEGAGGSMCRLEVGGRVCGFAGKSVGWRVSDWVRLLVGGCMGQLVGLRVGRCVGGLARGWVRGLVCW